MMKTTMALMVALMLMLPGALATENRLIYQHVVVPFAGGSVRELKNYGGSHAAAPLDSYYAGQRKNNVRLERLALKPSQKSVCNDPFDTWDYCGVRGNIAVPKSVYYNVPSSDSPTVQERPDYSTKNLWRNTLDVGAYARHCAHWVVTDYPEWNCGKVVPKGFTPPTRFNDGPRMW